MKRQTLCKLEMINLITPFILFEVEFGVRAYSILLSYSYFRNFLKNLVNNHHIYKLLKINNHAERKGSP